MTDLKKIRRLLQEAKNQSTCHTIRLSAVIETTAGDCILGWNGPPARAGSHPRCLVGGCITAENIGRCPGVHAEVRAICRAAATGRAIKESTLYLSEWFPCAPCTQTLIEAGIARLILTEEICFDKDECYHFHLAEELLRKSGVSIAIRKDLSLKVNSGAKRAGQQRHYP